MTSFLFKTVHIIVLAILSLSIAQANNNWTICHYEFNTLKVIPAEHTIMAELTKAKSLSGDCPKVHETLTFHPETLDYQGNLPLRKFPKVGQKRALIYRYLDGTCKNDGNDKPCRVEHFSVK